MEIIKANKVLWHLYEPLLKGTFGNEEVNKIIRKVCERMLIKETIKAWLAAKAWLAVAVAMEVYAQVENIINKEEKELNEQYMAIKIDYEAAVIGKA